MAAASYSVSPEPSQTGEFCHQRAWHMHASVLRRLPHARKAETSATRLGVSSVSFVFRGFTADSPRSLWRFMSRRALPPVRGPAAQRLMSLALLVCSRSGLPRRRRFRREPPLPSCPCGRIRPCAQPDARPRGMICRESGRVQADLHVVDHGVVESASCQARSDARAPPWHGGGAALPRLGMVRAAPCHAVEEARKRRFWEFHLSKVPNSPRFPGL